MASWCSEHALAQEFPTGSSVLFRDSRNAARSRLIEAGHHRLERMLLGTMVSMPMLPL